MSQRRPVVGGNWKMNLDLAAGVELAEDVVAGCEQDDLLARCDVVLYPAFPYLQAVGRALGHHPIDLGAQDVWHQPNGAFTGEVSTAMLTDLNVHTVLVGHSERRHVLGEDDDLVGAKARAAAEAGLEVTLCVGERREEREAGRTNEVNLRQLERGLAGIEADHARRLVIAYEPVWAIGTGLTASPEDADAVHAVIRDALRERYDDEVASAMRIQYGGSVKPGNAAELIAQPNIDGFLVGGASLTADDFLSIIRHVAEASDSLHEAHA